MVNSSGRTIKLFLAIFILLLMIAPIFAVNPGLPTSTANSINVINGSGKDTYNTPVNASSTGIYQPHLKSKVSTNLETSKAGKTSCNFNSDNTSFSLSGKRLYNITFNEYGLPAGMIWDVGILHERFRQEGFQVKTLPYSGYLMNMNVFEITNSSTTNSISVFLSNGKYEYFAGPKGTYYNYNSFYINGKSKNITLSFPKFYKVTFQVENLHKGIEWNVIALSINELKYYYNESSSLSMVAYLVNGTYNLLAGPKSTLINETFLKVNGKNITRTFKLPTLYTVTFKQVNIHSGIRWSVFTNNVTRGIAYHNSSYAHSMTAYLPGATYNYTMNYASIPNQNNISAIISFRVIHASRIFQNRQHIIGPSFTVNGKSQNITVTFPVTYKITFTENNIHSGLSWSITLNNENYSTYTIDSTHQKSIVMFLANGTYKYSALQNSPNHILLPGNETLVTGTSENVTVTFPVTYKIIFIENNVPSGALWTINVNYILNKINYSNSSFSRSMIAYLPDGNYTYNACFNHISYIVQQLNISNASRDTIVKFPVTYKITFIENNVPSGTLWDNYVYNKNHSISYYNSSSHTYMIAYLPNGTYNYCVNYYKFNNCISHQGKFTITNKTTSVSLKFPVTYKIIFTEYNVPSGVSWSIYININYRSRYYNSTSNSSMIAYLPDGNYTYTAYLSQISYLLEPFTVINASSNIKVTFPITYKVTFREINTMSRGNWIIKLENCNGTINYNNYSFGTSMIVYLPNGTYKYIPSYTPDDITISFSEKELSVNGKSENITVKFPVAYKVIFKETNIPLGTQWNINTNKCSSIESRNSVSSSSMTVYLPNGTYSYKGSYISNNTSISLPVIFTVSGSAMTVNVTFPVTYKITFIDNYVSSGINWGICLNNGDNKVSYYNSTSNSSMIAYLPDGIYSYHAYSSNLSTTFNLPESEFTVNNASINIVLAFGRTYNITFKEKGLPSGTSWSVTFNGLIKKSYNSSIIFSAVNGTYSYKVGKLSGYTLLSSNTLKVNGNNITEEIMFTHNRAKNTSFTLSKWTIYAIIGAIIAIIAVFILIIRKK